MSIISCVFASISFNFASASAAAFAFASSFAFAFNFLFLFSCFPNLNGSATSLNGSFGACAAYPTPA